MRIGELAERGGCSVETLRYYERERLLEMPKRSLGNYRHYAESDVARVQFIRHCRSLDMALSEIRSLLSFRDRPNEPCGDVNAVLNAHIAHVTHRIAELKALQLELTKMLKLCVAGEPAKDCGILRSLSKPAKVAVNRRSAATDHIRRTHR